MYDESIYKAMEDLAYSHSQAYAAQMCGIEDLIGFATAPEEKRKYQDEYLNNLRRYGAVTDFGRSLLRTMERDGIIPKVNLDSGIPQMQDEITPCTEGETDMAKYRQPVVINGQKTWISGNSLQEIVDKALKKGGDVQPEDRKPVPTLQAFVEETYSPIYIEVLRETTKANYHHYLDRYILPHLGDKPMDTITVADVQTLYNLLASGSKHGYAKDINADTIKRVSGLAKRIFKIAVELEIIPKTPFKDDLLKIKAPKAGHHKAMSDAEVDKIKRGIPSLKNDMQRAYMGILAYTDLRREELLGLHWEDVHLEEQYCSIEWTVTYPNNSKPCVCHETKTETSERLTLLPSPLVDILRPLRKEKGFVFGDEEALCYSTAQRIFRNAMKELGVAGVSVHDFRTTQATQRVEAGWTAKECADTMGHADTRMVETVYARRRKDGILKQLDKVEAMNAAYKVVGADV